MAVVDGIPVVQKGGIPENGKGSKGKKTEEDLKSFLDAYAYFRNYEHAIHFRIQTHGKVDEENCHPYKVGENCYLMHNGTLYQFTATSNRKLFEDSSKSDTWHFSQTLASFADKNWLRDPSFKKLLHILMGESNRIIFMDKRGFFMPRPDLWHLKDGVYYSNNHGIEQITTKFQSQAWTPHGHAGAGAGTSVPVNYKKEDLDQNQGHLFLSDGTRVISISERDYDKPSNGKKPESETGGEGTVKVLDRPKPIENPQETLNSLSFEALAPKDLSGWKELSLLAIENLVSAEPEMVADTIWEFVHE